MDRRKLLIIVDFVLSTAMKTIEKMEVNYKNYHFLLLKTISSHLTDVDCDNNDLISCLGKMNLRIDNLIQNFGDQIYALGETIQFDILGEIKRNIIFIVQHRNILDEIKDEFNKLDIERLKKAGKTNEYVGVNNNKSLSIGMSSILFSTDKGALKIKNEERLQRKRNIKQASRNYIAEVNEKPINGHVFISYVRENQNLVLKLAKDLEQEGIKVWLDRHNIHPGRKWRNAIREAIEEKSFFVACFSEEYQSRDSSYMDDELAVAIQELKIYSEDSKWFIPLKLNPCKIPKKHISNNMYLDDIQWIDMFEDWEHGKNLLLDTVSSARKPYPRGGNAVILNCDMPFKKRVDQALQSWIEMGRGIDGLLTGKAFFATMCWAMTNEILIQKPNGYNENMVDFLTASESLNGGFEGWVDHLVDHVCCERCRENYRFENIQIELQTMMYICRACAYG